MSENTENTETEAEEGQVPAEHVEHEEHEPTLEDFKPTMPAISTPRCCKTLW